MIQNNSHQKCYCPIPPCLVPYKKHLAIACLITTIVLTILSALSLSGVIHFGTTAFSATLGTLSVILSFFLIRYLKKACPQPIQRPLLPDRTFDLMSKSGTMEDWRRITAPKKSIAYNDFYNSSREKSPLDATEKENPTYLTPQTYNPAETYSQAFHLAIDPSEIESAFPLIYPILLSHEVATFKVLNTDSSATKDPHTQGKGFIIYVDKAREENLDFWETLLYEISLVLAHNRIKTEIPSPGDLPVEGSAKYVYYHKYSTLLGSISEDRMENQQFTVEEANSLTQSSLFKAIKTTVRPHSKPRHITGDSKRIGCPKPLQKQIYKACKEMGPLLLELLTGNNKEHFEQGVRNEREAFLTYLFGNGDWKFQHSHFEGLFQQVAFIAASLFYSTQKSPPKNLSPLSAFYHHCCLILQQKAEQGNSLDRGREDVRKLLSQEENKRLVKRMVECLFREETPFPNDVLITEFLFDKFYEISLKNKS